MSAEELPDVNVYTYDGLRDYHKRFVDEFLVDLKPCPAAVRAGFKPAAGTWLMQREDVRAVIESRMAERAFRVQVTSDMVLTELWAQVARLLAMLDTDLRDINTDDGKLKPIIEWPEIWRTAMVNGIEVEELFERSKDGGDSSWDKSGEVRKIKRESRLAIERQIKETLELIGRHTSIKAFETPRAGDTNVVFVTAETARRVTSARARLAAHDPLAHLKAIVERSERQQDE